MSRDAKVEERALYAPVKALLEGQGYEVKGEIAGADVVGLRNGEMVVVELKARFSLALFHQGIARLAATEAVYVAVPDAGPSKTRAANVKLARRVGLGVMVVRLRDGHVEVLCDPGPYRPRVLAARRGRLLREFARRRGDPLAGGSARAGIVTAYRRDALACARWLSEAGPARGSEVARGTGVARATRIMADDHYGWFERVERGVYALTAAGRRGLATYAGRA